MTSGDAALSIFTIFNFVRVLAYIPQMITIRRDPHGATAVSIASWTMFALSHGSTVFYAMFVASDPTLALVFSANTAFCFIIVALTIAQRRFYRRARAADWS